MDTDSVFFAGAAAMAEQFAHGQLLESIREIYTGSGWQPGAPWQPGLYVLERVVDSKTYFNVISLTVESLADMVWSCDLKRHLRLPDV